MTYGVLICVDCDPVRSSALLLSRATTFLSTSTLRGLQILRAWMRRLLRDSGWAAMRTRIGNEVVVRTQGSVKPDLSIQWDLLRQWIVVANRGRAPARRAAEEPAWQYFQGDCWWTDLSAIASRPVMKQSPRRLRSILPWAFALVLRSRKYRAIASRRSQRSPQARCHSHGTRPIETNPSRSKDERAMVLHTSRCTFRSTHRVSRRPHSRRMTLAAGRPIA